MKLPRVMVTCTLFALLIVGFFTLPLPISRVMQTGVVQVQPDAVQGVFIPEPAVLESLSVRDGQWVEKNQILARFTSLDQHLDAIRAFYEGASTA